MPQENYLSPCDNAVIDYCQSFFSRTLSLCWQDLPVNMQANRNGLFTLKDHFFEVLNHDFIGGANKHMHAVKTTENTAIEPLISAIALDMTGSLTQSSTLSLQGIHQYLNNNGHHNPQVFTPKSIATYLIKAGMLSQFSKDTLQKICLSFSGVFKERAHTFYSTLLDVITTAQKNTPASFSRQHAFQPSPHDAPQSPQQQHPSTQSPSINTSSNTEILTTYIQKFYCVNLYIKPSHPVLHSIHQNIYTQLIDYSRSAQSNTCESLGDKSEIIRHTLNALLALTTYPDTFFDQNAPLIHWKLEALSVADKTHRIRLQRFFDDIAAITHITTEPESAELRSSELQSREKSQPNSPSQHQKLSHHYARTGKTFNHVNSIINAINDEPPAQEIHHFIQQYWQHVLLITGLQFGVDSEKWNDILTTLQALVNVPTMLACSQSIQNNILEHMQALGKQYLSFNHFIEQEGYSLEVQNCKIVSSHYAS